MPSQCDSNFDDEPIKQGHDIFDDLNKLASPGQIKRKKIQKANSNSAHTVAETNWTDFNNRPSGGKPPLSGNT